MDRRVRNRGLPYQTLLNSILKEQMLGSARSDLRDEIRQILREELKRAR